MIWIVYFFLNYTMKNYMNTVAISVILKQANFSLPHNLQNSNSIKHYMMVHYCYQFWIIHLHFSFYWKIKCAKDKVEGKKKSSAWEGGLCKLRFCFTITQSRLVHPSILLWNSICPELAWAQSWIHRNFHIWEKALYMNKRQYILTANILNKHGAQERREWEKWETPRNIQKPSD